MVEKSGGAKREPRPPKVVDASGEPERIVQLLKRDRQDNRAELARITAGQEIVAGKFDNLAATVLLPTPEQLRHGKFEPFTPDKTMGTVRSTEGLRRVQVNRIVQLHQRGVLTDDTYPACLWYRRTWEACGFTTGIGAVALSERIGGEKNYGLLARTEMEVEARGLFAMAGRAMPHDMRGTFDRVVLEEMSITDAARAARCRYTNVTAVVRHAALLLFGAIQHLLPVRAVGALGSEPAAVDTDELDRLRRIEALAASTTLPGERAAADAAAARIRERLDPIFLDDDGFMRPWDQIAAITRGRVAGLADSEILAGLEEA